MKRLGHLLLLSVLLLAICSSGCSKGSVSDASAGVVSAGQSSIELRSAVAVLYEVVGKPHVEVTFFSEELSKGEEVAVAESYAFAKEVNGKPAILSIGLLFEKESTVCNSQNLVGYNIIFYDSEAFSVPVNIGSAQCSFGTPAGGWEEGTYGVTELAGYLRKGEIIRAHVTYEAVFTMGLAPGVDSLPLKWDVEVDCPLRVEG